ncbi:acyl-CoA thioester hydrolase YciA [Buchnera aphidicola]|uniref:Acyl-CoA thioester hydrolase YciA n=1 Tax=Buchnera aphidicola (Cinara cf. splendens/pseudotsugae 3390) TaxID=2518980 RepID=A0A451CWN1_9GAMM|nr:acyl-CoA thioester hydrolase YciA [Buchnera aphidicola]VFP77755.1 Acyl-CoA thioester hydrolase YciA [Buchnera aphidicola (Cinara cf. splendens/pseudotsugae 3390)]
MSKYKNNSIAKADNIMLKTLAMPSHKNVNGKIFGGWIMAQMDLGGGILAKEISKGLVYTVSAQDINFLKPISVGDVVTCYAQCIKMGNTSITIQIEIWVKKMNPNSYGISYCATTATFVYVSISEKGKPKLLSTINTA